MYVVRKDENGMASHQRLCVEHLTFVHLTLSRIESITEAWFLCVNNCRLQVSTERWDHIDTHNFKYVDSNPLLDAEKYRQAKKGTIYSILLNLVEIYMGYNGLRQKRKP